MIRKAAVPVALALLVGLLAPLAGADHVFTHRYLIYGRVVDDAGEPVVGERVDVEVDESVTVEGECVPQPDTGTEAWGATETRPVTNEHGEFFYCLHVHAIPRGTGADVHASVLGATASEPVNERFRVTYLEIRTDGDEGEPTGTFADSYLTSGRVWFSDTPKRIEGVSTFGDVLTNEPVVVTFLRVDGDPVRAETATNGYGDFAVRLPVADVAGGTVRVEVAGRVVDEQADEVFRSTAFGIEVEEPGRFDWLPWGLAAGGVAIAFTLGLYALSRWRKGREEAAVRERSTRRRAKR